MTDLLYLADSYRTDFEAAITAVESDGAILLDRTAFYPTGGGQPHDTGSIVLGNQIMAVTSVVKRDGQVLHVIQDEPSDVTQGSIVRGTIDWDRRYRLMRTHTALHVLCGVVFREFGARVTGGNMATDRARMDFELEDLSAERVSAIEALANDVIASGRNVSWETLPRAAAFEIPDLIRTRINLLPEGITEVRVVTIEGLDVQADGGTHVRNTREVGGIRVVGTRSKGRINKRLEIEIVDVDPGVGEGT